MAMCEFMVMQIVFVSDIHIWMYQNQQGFIHYEWMNENEWNNEIINLNVEGVKIVTNPLIKWKGYRTKSRKCTN